MGVHRCPHHLPHDPPRGRGHSDHHLVDAVAADEHGDLRQPPQHGKIIETVVLLAGVVVDEAHRGEAELRVGLQLAQNHFPGGSGADDQGTPSVGRPTQVLQSAESTYQQARSGDGRDREERVEDDDRDRDAQGGEASGGQPEPSEHRTRDGSSRGGLDDLCEVGNAGVAPKSAIHAERQEGPELQDDGDHGVDGRGVAVGRAPRGALEPDRVRDQRCCGEQQQVGQEQVAIPDARHAWGPPMVKPLMRFAHARGRASSLPCRGVLCRGAQRLERIHLRVIVRRPVPGVARV